VVEVAVPEGLRHPLIKREPAENLHLREELMKIQHRSW